MQYINEKQLKQAVEKEGMVLISLSANWCDVCLQNAAIVQEISREKHIPAYLIDWDRHRRFLKDIGIYGLPTLLVYSEGVLRLKLFGQLSVEDVRNLMNKVTES